MSAYGKFLWGVTVPSTDYDFATSLGTATVSAASFDTILEFLDELEDQLKLVNAGFSVTCSSIGTVAITGPAGWTWTTVATDDALSTLLGLDESADVVTADVLTGSSQHQRGWYPGTITRGRATTKGVGIAADRRWAPLHEGSQLFTMRGDPSSCFPATGLKRRELTIRPLTYAECIDEDVGVTAFIDEAIASTFRWYPDREDGTVADPGTQDTDYYECSFVGVPEWRGAGRNPDLFQLNLVLNRCPA